MLRAVRVVVCFVVPLTALTLAAGSVVRRHNWLQDRLQRVVAAELARTTGREVRVGSLEGDLRHGVVLRDVAVGEEGGLAQGEVLWVEELQVKYDLNAILHREQPPARAVSEVVIRRPRVTIVRRVDGTINLQELVKPSKKRVPPEERFAGKVRIEDADITYIDETLTSPDGKPLRQHVVEADVELDLGRPDWLAFTTTMVSADESFGELRASGAVDQKTHFVSADATISEVPLRRWYEFYGPRPEAEVLGGVADVAGSVYVLPPSGEGKPETGYDLSAAIRGGKFRVPQVRSGPIELSGDVRVTPAGLVLAGGRVRVAGVNADVNGTVSCWEDPTIDATVEAQGVTMAAVKALLPAGVEFPPAGVPLEIEGAASVRAQVAGSLARGSVKGEVKLPGRVVVEVEGVGRLVGDGLQADVKLLDWSGPQVEADVRVARLVVPSVALGEESEDGEPAPTLQLEPLRNVRAKVLWANGKAVAAGKLQVGSASIDQVRISDLSGDYVFADDVLRLTHLRASVLGGTIEGDGVVALANGEQPLLVYCRGRIADVRIDNDQKLPFKLGVPLSCIAERHCGGQVQYCLGRGRVSCRQAEAHDRQAAGG